MVFKNGTRLFCFAQFELIYLIFGSQPIFTFVFQKCSVSRLFNYSLSIALPFSNRRVSQIFRFDLAFNKMYAFCCNIYILWVKPQSDCLADEKPNKIHKNSKIFLCVTIIIYGKTFQKCIQPTMHKRTNSSKNAKIASIYRENTHSMGFKNTSNNCC